MKQFQFHMNNKIINITNICIYCTLFILFEANILLIEEHPDFILAIKFTIIVDKDLNCFRYIDNSFHFCKLY